MAAEAVLRLHDAALVMLGATRQPAVGRRAGREVARAALRAAATSCCRRSTPTTSGCGPRRPTSRSSPSRRTRSTSACRRPNKFWESLAAGTPVVIGRDLEVMRADRRGGRARRGRRSRPTPTTSPARCATSSSSRRGDYAAMRERCLAVTRDRYNWETAVVPYLELVAGSSSAPFGCRDRASLDTRSCTPVGGTARSCSTARPRSRARPGRARA